jgi:hypothetical protein
MAGPRLVRARNEVVTTDREPHRSLRGNGSESRSIDASAEESSSTPEGRTTEADFFISYTAADEAQAEWVSWTLEEAGYRVVFQKWDFVPGSNFVLEMDKAARTAKRTILVLSRSVVTKLFPAPEWAAAFAADPSGWARKLVPVRIDEVDAAGLLGQITYIDLFGIADDDARRDRLLTGLAARAKPATAPLYPNSTAPSSHVGAPEPTTFGVSQAILEGFIAPERGRPDRSSFNGVGLMRLLIAPTAAFRHPAGVRVGQTLEAAVRAAASEVGAFVKPQFSPRSFDWIQRFAPRGSLGWSSGEAS